MSKKTIVSLSEEMDERITKLQEQIDVLANSDLRMYDGSGSGSGGGSYQNTNVMLDGSNLDHFVRMRCYPNTQTCKINLGNIKRPYSTVQVIIEGTLGETYRVEVVDIDGWGRQTIEFVLTRPFETVKLLKHHNGWCVASYYDGKNIAHTLNN